MSIRRTKNGFVLNGQHAHDYVRMVANDAERPGPVECPICFNDAKGCNHVPTVHVFGVQRPSDSKPWFLAFTDQALALKYPHRVTLVETISLLPQTGPVK